MNAQTLDGLEGRRLRQWIKSHLALFGAIALAAYVGSACATVGPIATDVLHCGEDAIVKQVPGLTTDIITVLQTGGSDWSTVLTSLINAAGQAGMCAWEIVYAQLTSGVGVKEVAIPPGATSLTSQQVQFRAQQFQAQLASTAKAAGK